MAVRALARVHYPESDGKPIGETEAHFWCIARLAEMVAAFFADAPDVWVGSNQMHYYVEGDPRKVYSPDLCVVVGAPKLPPRRTYRHWVEGRPPTLVAEVTSRKTRHEDTVDKRALYERLGVQEYALFDPLDEYLRPRLQGFRLVGGTYQPVEPNAAGRLTSTVLGLELEPRGYYLALFDPRAGEYLPMPHEEAAARRAEAAARQAAEAEVARLRAELERLTGPDR